jgi:hypothetical protein
VAGGEIPVGVRDYDYREQVGMLGDGAEIVWRLRGDSMGSRHADACATADQRPATTRKEYSLKQHRTHTCEITRCTVLSFD